MKIIGLTFFRAGAQERVLTAPLNARTPSPEPCPGIWRDRYVFTHVRRRPCSGTVIDDGGSLPLALSEECPNMRRDRYAWGLMVGKLSDAVVPVC